ncbi:TPA: restriction endonuclease, SacI family [Bacillus pseudomycoides]|nr:restriction endonuclease, SacI family [Bacillus pseudomycoides]
MIIPKEKAESILETSFELANSNDYSPSSKFTENILKVLNGGHKTYKYIMVNALLAKATSEQINPLCLQKKSKLPGSYDARSLCHSVLVKFERDYLHGALGNSNEPFLNKPARFTELDPENAVRAGRDRELLLLLCNFLPQFTTSQEAYIGLTDSLYYLKGQVEDKKKLLKSLTISSAVSIANIEAINIDLLNTSFGGESLVLSVGTLLKYYSTNIIGSVNVKIHPVNQSGASSKEIGDIDFYKDKQISFTVEAKDKAYSSQDVLHAVRKASESGCHKLFFITGPRGTLSDPTLSHTDLIEQASKLGVYLVILTHRAFIKTILSLTPDSNISSLGSNFFNVLLSVSEEARLRDETKTHLLETAQKHKLIQ